MKCFYHKSDFDGKCAGAIVKYFHPECELYGVDYSDTLDMSLVCFGETIVVVDFCFSRTEMLLLFDAATLIWIDHHKSSIDSLSDLPIKGLREVGRSGCELAWELFSIDLHAPPKVVHLLGRYDVWDHKNTDVVPFQYGMRAQKNTEPTNMEFWFPLFASDVGIPRILKTGKLILEYQEQQDEYLAKSMAYDVMLEGHRAIAMNRSHANSLAFKSVYDPAKHDIMIAYAVRDKQYKYTLYCDKPEIDVSELAKQFGGGGHRGAAGFYSSELLI